jgi:hypothetical protein
MAILFQKDKRSGLTYVSGLAYDAMNAVGGVGNFYQIFFDLMKSQQDYQKVMDAIKMKRLYERKYRPLIQEAEQDMEKCNGDGPEAEQCFEEVYRRWRTAKEDFKVECYSLWRDRIAAEQEGFKKINQPGRFEGLESLIAGDYLKITLDALRLPELGVG